MAIEQASNSADSNGGFDPYHKWLGIPRNERPPSFYRLLAIERFENDVEVIENAADKTMAHLRNFLNEPYVTIAQKLLNEVARAKVTLLNPKKKAQYDYELRAQGSANPIQQGQHSMRKALPQAVSLSEPLPSVISPAQPKLPPAQRKTSNKIWAITAGAAAGVAAIGAAIWGASRGSNDESEPIAQTQPTPQVAPDSGGSTHTMPPAVRPTPPPTTPEQLPTVPPYETTDPVFSVPTPPPPPVQETPDHNPLATNPTTPESTPTPSQGTPTPERAADSVSLSLLDGITDPGYLRTFTMRLHQVNSAIRTNNTEQMQAMLTSFHSIQSVVDGRKARGELSPELSKLYSHVCTVITDELNTALKNSPATPITQSPVQEPPSPTTPGQPEPTRITQTPATGSTTQPPIPTAEMEWKEGEWKDLSSEEALKKSKPIAGQWNTEQIILNRIKTTILGATTPMQSAQYELDAQLLNKSYDFSVQIIRNQQDLTKFGGEGGIHLPVGDSSVVFLWDSNPQGVKDAAGITRFSYTEGLDSVGGRNFAANPESKSFPFLLTGPYLPTTCNVRVQLLGNGRAKIAVEMTKEDGKESKTLPLVEWEGDIKDLRAGAQWKVDQHTLALGVSRDNRIGFFNARVRELEQTAK